MCTVTKLFQILILFVFLCISRVRAIGQNYSSSSVPNIKAQTEKEEMQSRLSFNNNNLAHDTWSNMLANQQTSQSTYNLPQANNMQNGDTEFVGTFINNPVYRRKSVPVFIKDTNGNTENGHSNMVKQLNSKNQTRLPRVNSYEIMQSPKEQVKTPGSSSGYSEPSGSAGSTKSPSKPSLFHPSIIQGSSTPMSSPYKSGTDTATTPGTSDGLESPIIRGHKVKKTQRRRSGKENVLSPPVKVNFGAQPNTNVEKSPPKESPRFVINATQPKRMKITPRSLFDGTQDQQEYNISASEFQVQNTSRVVIDGRNRSKDQSMEIQSENFNGLVSNRVEGSVEVVPKVQQNGERPMQFSEVTFEVNQNGIVPEAPKPGILRKSTSNESLNGYDNIEPDEPEEQQNDSVEQELVNKEINPEVLNKFSSENSVIVQDAQTETLTSPGYYIEPNDPVLKISGVADMSPSVITRDNVRYQALKRHNEIMSQVDQILNRAMESLKKTSSPPGGVTSPRNLVSPRSAYASQELLKIPSPDTDDTKLRSISAPDPSTAKDGSRNSSLQRKDKVQPDSIIEEMVELPKSQDDKSDLNVQTDTSLSQSIAKLHLNENQPNTIPVISVNQNIMDVTDRSSGDSVENMERDNRTIQESVQFIRNQLKEMEEASGKLPSPKKSPPLESSDGAFKPYKLSPQKIEKNSPGGSSVKSRESCDSLENLLSQQVSTWSSVEKLKLSNENVASEKLVTVSQGLTANTSNTLSVGFTDEGSTLIPQSVTKDSEFGAAFSQLSDISSDLSKLSGMLDNVSMASTSSLLNAKPDQLSWDDLPVTKSLANPIPQTASNSITSMSKSHSNHQPAEPSNQIPVPKVIQKESSQPNLLPTAQTVPFKNSPIKTEKLGVLNPMAIFSPIQTFPTTPRDSETIVAPNIIKKTILQQNVSQKSLSITSSENGQCWAASQHVMEGQRHQEVSSVQLIRPQPRKPEPKPVETAAHKAKYVHRVIFF